MRLTDRQSVARRVRARSTPARSRSTCPVASRDAPSMECRSQDNHGQADGGSVRHQQAHLHRQSRRFPGMEREVKKVEAGVRDRVAEQRDMTEEDGRDERTRDDLGDQKEQRCIAHCPRFWRACKRKRLDREKQQRHDRERRPGVSRKSNGDVRSGGQQRRGVRNAGKHPRRPTSPPARRRAG